MELIDYMRKRNQMTENEWENSFEEKEQEILVLRYEGDVTSKRNGFWEVAVCCLGYSCGKSFAIKYPNVAFTVSPAPETSNTSFAISEK